MQEPHQNFKHQGGGDLNKFNNVDPQILGATTKFSCPGFVHHFALDGHKIKALHLLLSSKEWTYTTFCCIN